MILEMYISRRLTTKIMRLELEAGKSLIRIAAVDRKNRSWRGASDRDPGAEFMGVDPAELWSAEFQLQS